MDAGRSVRVCACIVCVCVCQLGTCLGRRQKWSLLALLLAKHFAYSMREERRERREEAEGQQAQPETEMYATCTVVTEICHRSAMATKRCLISNINK